VSHFWAELRQRRQYRAFRIDEPRWTEEQCRELDQVIALLGEADPPVEAGTELDEKALAEAATNLWRAQQKLAQLGSGSTQSRQASRYLRSCAEALTDAGLVVQDHDGDPFHAGRSVEVLVYQDDPTVSAETIVETVRPSVYYRDRRIQMGQVIVGCPPVNSSLPGDNHA
jgi:hypothetical protein